MNTTDTPEVPEERWLTFEEIKKTPGVYKLARGTGYMLVGEPTPYGANKSSSHLAGVVGMLWIAGSGYCGNGVPVPIGNIEALFGYWAEEKFLFQEHLSIMVVLKQE